MKTDVHDILNVKDEITEEFIEKINKFYNNEEYLIFINYCSEKNSEEEDIKMKINSNFLKNEKNFKYKYKEIKFALNENENIGNINNYINIKNKYLKRIELLLPYIFINIDLNNEILISALLEPIDNLQNCSKI